MSLWKEGTVKIYIYSINVNTCSAELSHTIIGIRIGWEWKSVCRCVCVVCVHKKSNWMSITSAPNVEKKKTESWHTGVEWSTSSLEFCSLWDFLCSVWNWYLLDDEINKRSDWTAPPSVLRTGEKERKAGQEKRRRRMGRRAAGQWRTRLERWCCCCLGVRWWPAGCWWRGVPRTACCRGAGASSRWSGPDLGPPQSSGFCAAGWSLEWLWGERGPLGTRVTGSRTKCSRVRK